MLTESEHIETQDVITTDQYELLDEGAKRAFKRKGSSLTHYFRCTSGPKAGKLASDPSKCGQRPDPKRVRHGRKVAKLKGSVRVRKTQMKKKTELSKRISRLNKQLMGHNSTKSESFSQYRGLATLVESVLVLVESTHEDFFEQVATQLLDGKYDAIILEQFIGSDDPSVPVTELIIESLLED